MALNIVLVEPEIPQNTGSIARSCALTNTKLHLVRPLGFSLSDKYLKRAGLDYWHLLDVSYYDNFSQLLEKYSKAEFYYATTKADNLYTEVNYKDECFIVFGKETKGLSKEILEGNLHRGIKIPMLQEIGRSYNLSNSVNIILFEVLRQLNFYNIK